MNPNVSEDQAKKALNDKEREAEKLLNDSAQTHETLKKAEGLLDKLRKMPAIGKLVDDIATAIELVKDFIDGRYRRVPTPVIISTLAGLLYIISPIDIIPDFIPVFGWVDDALVFTLVLYAGLSAELSKYRKWKEPQKEPVFEPIWADSDESED